MKFKTLEDLLKHGIQDLYSAEKQIIQALPKMAKAASAPDLKAAFESHLNQTQEQLKRLEQIFEAQGWGKGNKKCKGMEGLITEGQEMIQEDIEKDVLDAALIEAAQKVEHYEIAGYGTARTFAKLLGLHDVAKLLQTTLDEEAMTDENLTILAERHINREAAR